MLPDQSLQPLNVIIPERKMINSLYHTFREIQVERRDDMQTIEQTLDSREVAEMIEKEHSKLLWDLRRYEEQFIEAKIGFNDFFRNSEVDISCCFVTSNH